MDIVLISTVLPELWTKILRKDESDKSLCLSGVIIDLETPQIFFDPDFLTLNHRYNYSAVQITKKVYILYKNKICQI